jgi:hypothetical protein
MTIQQRPVDSHWNYFIALEQDAERISRFIQFSTKNFEVFSIELARLLFAAASEFEVVGKLLCSTVTYKPAPSGFPPLRQRLNKSFPGLDRTRVFVPRYGLTLEPLKNFGFNKDPDWWVAYSRVKHNRDSDFTLATLGHALNSIAGLLLLLLHLFVARAENAMTWMDAVETLDPKTVLFQPENTIYRGQILR